MKGHYISLRDVMSGERPYGSNPRSLRRPELPRNPFYSSPAWLELRYDALKRAGGYCECCGAAPTPAKPLHVDHIKPRKLFPQLALDVDNLQILCGECNHGKGNWDMTDWRQSSEA